MTSKINRIVSILCVVAALFSAALLPVSGYCENLRFVFMADSRGSYGTPIINTAVLNAISNKILSFPQQPSFVIYGGDQAYRGCIDDVYTFDDFKKAMKSLTDTGITLYTAMGNHELYVKGATDDQGFVLTNQEAFQTAFASNPANGPAGYTPSYDHLVYSFESPQHDAFFAVLDPYFLTADVSSPSLDGAIDAPQLSWLADQLAQTKATHKFVFSHAPYYYIYKLSTGGISYTNLWRLMDQNGVDVFFCGHTHLFSRKNIDSSIAPDPQLSPPVTWNSNVFQVITGTCGAEVNGGTSLRDVALWHVSNAADTYYFSVVDINGSNIQVTTYSGNTGDYSVLDTFSVNKGLLPGNFLLLLD
jgi:3',5'-cyclic AMP phosphodiesterase CpdA